jgi:hypothetical protein
MRSSLLRTRRRKEEVDDDDDDDENDDDQKFPGFMEPKKMKKNISFELLRGRLLPPLTIKFGNLMICCVCCYLRYTTRRKVGCGRD